MTDHARDVALLIEQLLNDSISDPIYLPHILSADMGGMMAAIEVTMNDGFVVIVEVNSG